MDGKTTWLDRCHPFYNENREKWQHAQAHYTGDVLNPGCISYYLVRKTFGETPEQFHERTQLADYTPHFSTVIDSLAGMLTAVDDDATRVFGSKESMTDGLGDPENKKTPIGRLWQNADGSGLGWNTLWKQLAIELLVTCQAWVIVGETPDVEESAMVKIWPALAVTNWREENGRLVEVVVRRQVDKRSTLKGEKTDGLTSQWLLYTLEGIEVYEKNEQGDPLLVDHVDFVIPFTDEQGNAILPIVRAELPLRRQVGWLLSKKANAIFNKESERDNILRVANFPKLQYVGMDEQFEKAAKALLRGVNMLQSDPNVSRDHSYIQPASESADIATQVLQRKVEEFYVTAFREYGDAARERTATEVRQDVSSGVGALLQLLKAAVDDAENAAMVRVAQIELPRNQAAWFNNTVARSSDFLPIDVPSAIEKLRARYFTDRALPIGRSGKLAAVKQVASWDGISVSELEVLADIDLDELERLKDLFAQLPIPAEVIAEITMDFLIGSGKVDAEAKDEDGKLVAEQIRTRVLELAQAKEQASARQREFFSDLGPPGQTGGDDDDEVDDEDRSGGNNQPPVE